MAKSANLIYSRHFSITGVTTSGKETANLVGGSTRGVLDTMVIRKVSGSASTVDIQVRLKTGNSNAEYLIYEATGESLSSPVRETAIGALFDTLSTDSDSDLYLYLDPDASGTPNDFAVRLDFRIQQ